LLKWQPLDQVFEFEDMQWHDQLMGFGVQDGTYDSAKLLTAIVEKSVIPKFQIIMTNSYDLSHCNQTKFAIRCISRLLDYTVVKSDAMQNLLDSVEDRINSFIQESMSHVPVSMNQSQEARLEDVEWKQKWLEFYFIVKGVLTIDS
jgi:hypothetical protein